MRIVHTSDWHLGQIFYGKSRLAEQKRFINWLQIVLKSLKINAIIVAGDIFHSARPSYEAQRMLADFLAFCAQEQIHAIITAGNHDSPDCLQINAQIADATHYVHIVAKESKIIDLAPVCIAASPFLIPEKVEDLNQISSFSIRHFADLAKRARSLYEGRFLIGVGHLATEVHAQDGEQAIYIGHSACVDESKLNMFDYFAMGHIHQASGLARRYSGSIMAMGFDENQQKSISLLCINEQIELENPRKISDQAWLYTINVPIFSRLISIDASSASELDLSTASANAHIRINLQDCSQDECHQLHETARELGLKLAYVRNKAQEKSEEIELNLDDLSPKIVLEQILKERNLPLDEALLNELNLLEIEARKELDSKKILQKALD